MKILINNNQLTKGARGIQRYFDSVQPYLLKSFEMEMLFSGKTPGVLQRKVREQLFFLRGKKYDVLWSPSHASAPYFAGRHVVTLHDLIPIHPESGISRAYVQYFRNSVRLVVRKAAHIVCISASVADQVQMLYGVRSSRLSVVRNGFDFPGALPHNRTTTADVRFLLFVGTFSSHKNLVRLVEAFMMYKAKAGGNNKLIIVGNFPKTLSLGKMDLDLQSLESKGISTRTNLTDDELHKLYRDCHGVVMPSVIEGFGLPIAEALSYSKPVICSDIAVFRELFGDMIRAYFNPYEPQSICDAIGYIFSSSDVLNTTELESSLRVRNWTWEKVADRYKLIFESLI